MYTFQPLASIPASHDGFAFICFVTIAILIVVFFAEDLAYLVIALVPASLVVLLAYCVSYVWTDQTPKTFKNEVVVGEFVQYVAEGYNETIRSGKTTRQVDRHNTYVVYRVNGQLVMLESQVGLTYPQRATLYKN